LIAVCPGSVLIDEEWHVYICMLHLVHARQSWIDVPKMLSDEYGDAKSIMLEYDQVSVRSFAGTDFTLASRSGWFTSGPDEAYAPLVPLQRLSQVG